MIAPDLSRRLDKLSARQLRQICAAVCGTAIRQTRLGEPTLNEALAVLHSIEPASQTLRNDAVALAERFDTIYFDLQDAAGERRAAQAQVHEAFFRARAASAVAIAISGLSADIAKEVIYEAVAATDNLAELEDIIHATLGLSHAP